MVDEKKVASIKSLYARGAISEAAYKAALAVLGVKEEAKPAVVAAVGEKASIGSSVDQPLTREEKELLQSAPVELAVSDGKAKRRIIEKAHNHGGITIDVPNVDVAETEARIRAQSEDIKRREAARTNRVLEDALDAGKLAEQRTGKGRTATSNPSFEMLRKKGFVV